MFTVVWIWEKCLYEWLILFAACVLNTASTEESIIDTNFTVFTTEVPFSPVSYSTNLTTIFDSSLIPSSNNPPPGDTTTEAALTQTAIIIIAVWF